MRLALSPFYLVSITSLAVALAGCGGDGGGITLPATGTLEIRTTTTGESPGYTVSVDGATEQAIGANATLTSDVEAGSHTVLLGGLPAGCSVAGDNPRTVTVTAGSTTTVTFTINCAPPLGSINVTTATTGPPPASYTVLVDGASSGTIPASGALQVPNVAAGSHLVGLADVPANCQVQGQNPQTVVVTPPALVSAAFAITCTQPPAQSGILSITTATTGSSPDPDGYQVVLDGQVTQPIGVNATVTVLGVATGGHSVRLTGAAPNCTVSGSNPRAVTVSSGQTAVVSFEIVCSAMTGSIRVTTQTTGPDPDADGYTLLLDEALIGSIGPNEQRIVPDVSVGPHRLELQGLETNCSAEESPQDVTVAAGATVEASFTVTCAAISLVRWSRMESGTSDNLIGVWGSSGTDVFAVGVEAEIDVASIQHYNGQMWSEQHSFGDARLWGVWGSGPEDVFAVGDSRNGLAGWDGVILHYDGAAWTQMMGPGVGTPETQVFFRDVWGTSSIDVWAVGRTHTGAADLDSLLVAHYNGSSWSPAGQPPAQGVGTDVHGTSATDVWVVGFFFPQQGSFIQHLSASGWTVFAPPGPANLVLSAVWANSSSDVFAVGRGGGNAVVLHFDGSRWSVIAAPRTASLNDIWGTGPTDMYAVGNGIFHFDGTTWTNVSQQQASAIWGSSATDIFAVGENGAILHGTAASAARQHQ